MSVTVTTYCDCCREEIHLDRDGETWFKKRVRRFHKPHWPKYQPPEVEWTILCEDCWREIADTVRKRKRARGVGDNTE